MNQSSDGAFDALILGGGPAGLNAALVLARARRRVLVLDGGEPRNAASHALHGFLSRDGIDPAELLRIGRLQLEAYPGARLVPASAVSARPVADGFEVDAADGSSFRGRKLLFAIGVRDELPEVEGFRGLYGRSAFHCPYCDGWEAREQPVAVLGKGAGGVRLALLLLGWSGDVVLCTDGPAELSPDQMTRLAGQGVPLREERISRLEGSDGQLDRIVFGNGASVIRRALFFDAPVHLDYQLPGALGCAMTESGRIQVDEAGATSVPGVYAAGDGARRTGQHPASQVVLAAASGSLAGIALHQELLHEDVGFPLPVLATAPARTGRT